MKHAWRLLTISYKAKHNDDDDASLAVHMMTDYRGHTP